MVRFYLCSIALILASLCGQTQTKDYDQVEKGIELYNVSQYDSSIIVLQKGLSNCKNCPDTVAGYFHIYIAKSFQLLEEFDSALIHFQRASKILLTSENSNALTYCYVSLAEYYRSLHRFELAGDYLEKSQLIIDEGKVSKHIQAKYYSRLAAVTQEYKGDLVLAKSYSQKVLEIAKQIGDANLVASSLNEIGFIYENLNELNQAKKNYEEAIEVLIANKNTRDVASVSENIIRILIKQNSIDEALILCQKALKESQKNGYTLIEKNLQFHLSQIYEKQGKQELAMEAFKKFHEMEKENIYKTLNKDIYKLESQFNVESEKKAAAQALVKEQLAQTELKSKVNQRNWLVVLSVTLTFSIAIILFLLFKMRSKNKQLFLIINDKEILFNEVHHRVKNNLTLLKSLLFLRAKSSDNDEVKVVLEECQYRIDAMAAVHQNLYNIDETSKVQLKSFISQLFNELKESILPGNKTLHIIVEGDDIEMDMSISIFIGLVLNELAINSMKYAQIEEGKLQIGVTLKRDEKLVSISYFDNGKGLPENVTLQTGGFGFKLIRIMMDQLNTEMNYQKTATKAIFNFVIGQ